MGAYTQLSGSFGKLGSFQYVPLTSITWYSTWARAQHLSCAAWLEVRRVNKT